MNEFVVGCLVGGSLTGLVFTSAILRFKDKVRYALMEANKATSYWCNKYNDLKTADDLFKIDIE